VQVAPEVLAYVVDLCRATRTSPSLSLGVSPRGATALLSTAKAWAWLSGRDYVTPDDVKALARPTLRHRVAVRPRPSWRASPATACSTACSPRCPSPASGPRGAHRPGGAAGALLVVPVALLPSAGRSCWALVLLLVVALVDVLLAVPVSSLRCRAPGDRLPARASRPRSRCA
jgi:hypothetical protein